MDFGEIVFYIVIALVIAHFNYKFFFKMTEAEKEYEKKLKESLADEFLYDPKTGTKFSLEEANENITVLNDQKIKSEEELNYYEGDERTIEEISNYLKQSHYLLKPIEKKKLSKLNRTVILSQYSDWHYQNAFEFDNDNLIFFPQVNLNANTRYSFTGYQIVFWVKVQNINGHYFFKPFEIHEKIINFFMKPSKIKTNNYAVFELKQSHNIYLLNSILNVFKDEKNIEIEIDNDNLFIKTNNQPSLVNFQRLLDQVKNSSF